MAENEAIRMINSKVYSVTSHFVGSKKNPRKYFRHNYTCGSYSRSGKMACSSHYIKLKDIEEIVLADIRHMAELTVDEEAARKVFSAKKNR